MITRIAKAPCDKCGREISTDDEPRRGDWYFINDCNYIYGDGCDGQADTTQVTEEEIDIH